MEALWQGFELFITVFEAFLLMFFLCSFFDFRFSSLRRYVVLVVSSLLFALMVNMINNITTYEGLIGIIYSVYFFIFSAIFFEGSVILKVFVSILTNVCLLVFNALSSSMIALIFKDNYKLSYSDTPSVPRFIMIVSVQMMLVAAFYFLVKLFGRGQIELEKKDWVFSISIYGITFVAISGIHYMLLNCQLSEMYVTLLTISEFCLVLINCLCIYMVSKLNHSHKLAMEYQLAKQQNEMQLQYAQNAKNRYDETRRIQHDMKQHFSVIEHLLYEKKYDEILQYTRMEKNEIYKLDSDIICGNSFLSVVVNAKLAMAKDYGIHCTICITKDELGIDSTDLCSLVGNMFDNAIEAARKCSPETRFIEVEISTNGKWVIIQLGNSVCAPVLAENKELKTTKENSSEHGYGTKTINHIAKKYSGFVVYRETENMFYSKVKLYDKKLRPSFPTMVIPQ